MKNFIQPGDTITIPAPADVLSGEVVAVGSHVGIAAGHAAEGAPLDLTLVGVFEVPKIAANAFAVGDRVFWNAEDSLATTTVGSNPRVGTAVEAAAASTATVRVRLVQI